MSSQSGSQAPPLGLGVASVVLGVISTLLFFLPVLATPIAVIGLILAVIGCALGATSGQASLRWSSVGLVVSGLALTINLAIAYAPSGFEHTPAAPPSQPVPGVPYAPPPARPSS
ncbi:MAG TPA: hypothetical protein VEI07_03055 [Planctomycetaceae bacterium]|nr:hypothetical protein [Planctomycetaceae bacterium]